MKDKENDQCHDPSVQEMAQAGQQIRDMLDEAGDGFFETDVRGQFTQCNHSFCRILSYPRADILGREFGSFMDQDQARKIHEALNRVWVGHHGFSNLIWTIQDGQDQNKVVELSAYLVRNHAGRKMGFRGIARDVTDEFKTINALQEARRRYEQEFQAERRARRRAKNLLDFVPYPMVVFTRNGQVTYINPAFTQVFGWALEELIGKGIPFIPPDLKEQSLEDLKRLLREKNDTIETRRLTKDGRVLDVVIRGQVTSPEEEERFGELLILRDVTEERRMERINEALFDISKALPEHPSLEDLLDYISGQVKKLLNAEAALVGLLDKEKKAFTFLGAAYDDPAIQKKVKTLRHPFQESLSGRVVESGQSAIVLDPSQEPDFYDGMDRSVGFETRNVVIVPLEGRENVVGVLIAVNKRQGDFDARDQKFLSMIASTVALSIENAEFSKELHEAYQEVASLNRAKDKIINHLSHELKTPVSVVLASLNMLTKKLEALPSQDWKNTLNRAKRNLDRILDIQYQVADIMKDPEYRTYSMLSFLLEDCRDQLEVLLAEKCGEGEAVQWMHERIERDFGPRDSAPDEIQLDVFVQERLDALRSSFAHRDLPIKTFLEPAPPVCIPSSVLGKVVDGLIKNAIENTPDNSKIEILVQKSNEGSDLVVRDYGVGITPENQKRIFEGFFSTQDIMLYSSRKPFDFNAGGKGADLLRMKVFAERYGFQMNISSVRCPVLSGERSECPGDIDRCLFCRIEEDCYRSGGTTFTLHFSPKPGKSCPTGQGGQGG